VTMANRNVWDEEFFGYLQHDALKLTTFGVLAITWMTLIIARDIIALDSLLLWMPAILITGGSCGLTLLVEHRWGFRMAGSVLVVGLAGAVAVAFWGTRRTEALYLSIPVLSLAYGLLGPQTGVALGVSFLAVGAAGVAAGFLTAPQLALPMLIMLVTVGLTAMSQYHIYTGLRQTWDSYQSSLKIAEEARRHRAELARVTKSLDEAYQRLRHLNEAYVEAWQVAEEAKRFKAEFAANISHELRTPLNIIVGLTELMIQSPESYGGVRLPSAYWRDLSIVYRNARHLAQLVDDVLDLARIEAARMNMVMQEVDATSLVREAVEIIRPLVTGRGLTLRVEIQDGLPRLWADPTRVRQVLLNLMSNATRFTEEGSITVTVKRSDHHVQFSVADTGIGIAPEDVPKIFEAFHQLSTSPHKKQQGVGLGLTLSKHFVELHGGKIWVESRPGQGSTFYFTLPVTEKGTTERPVLPSLLSFTPPLRLEEGDRVLVAITRSAAGVRLLDRYVEGYRTVMAPDLDHARSWIQKLCPHGVVVDATEEWTDPQHLPQFAQILGAIHLPIILCPLPGAHRLGAISEAAGYLPKPVQRETLFDLLRQFGERVETILIIDDDRDFVGFLARLLEDRVRPYRVLAAYRGSDGLELIRRHKPDLVFLDLVMPDMDGVEVLRCMRSEPDLRHIPVVIVSGRGDQGDTGMLSGVITFTKAEGFQPAQMTRWIGAILKATPRSVSGLVRGPVKLSADRSG